MCLYVAGLRYNQKVVTLIQKRRIVPEKYGSNSCVFPVHTDIYIHTNHIHTFIHTHTHTQTHRMYTMLSERTPSLRSTNHIHTYTHTHTNKRIAYIQCYLSVPHHCGVTKKSSSEYQPQTTVRFFKSRRVLFAAFLRPYGIQPLFYAENCVRGCVP
jgi:hypothetical protein